MRVAAKQAGQALVAEFIAFRRAGLARAVGIKQQRVSRFQAHCSGTTVQGFEQTKNPTGRLQPSDSAISAYQQRSEVAAIDVTQQPALVVVLREEQSCVASYGELS